MSNEKYLQEIESQLDSLLEVNKVLQKKKRELVKLLYNTIRENTEFSHLAIIQYIQKKMSSVGIGMNLNHIDALVKSEE